MPTQSIISVFLILSQFSVTSAQINPGADLTLQNEITLEYILDYLGGKKSAWDTQLALGIDDEATMKAHMGLAFLAFAWSHIDADTLNIDFDPVINDLTDNLDSLLGQIDDHILPILSAGNIDSFFAELVDFFQSGDYVIFRDSVSSIFNNIDMDLTNVDSLFQNWLDDIGENFSDPNFQAHIDSVAASTVDFRFALQVIGSGYDDSLFVFDRTLFNHLDTLDVIFSSVEDAVEGAVNQFDAALPVSGGDVTLAVDSLRLALGKLSEAVDTLKAVLTSDPFSTFDIDTQDLDSLSEALAELDTLLGGKVYDIGPDVEGKTIVPLRIIVNLPGNGLQLVLEDFYRASDPTVYNFGGIFPDGMPEDGLAWVSPDAVLNEADNEDELYNRLQLLEAGWQLDVAAEMTDPDAHFGLALVQAFELVYDHVDVYEDIFQLLENGHLDSLAAKYSWADVDITDELDLVQSHFDYYADALDANTNFVVLVKTADDGLDKYVIGPESEFEIIMIPAPVAAVASIWLDLAIGSVELAVEGLSNIYAGIDDVFILDLDPTVLDFSVVESDSDLVILLETSNPEFFSLTPYGVEQFIIAGDNLENAFHDLDKFFAHMTNLAYAMAPYDADFDIDGQLFIDNMEAISEVVSDIHEDFLVPDSTVIIDGERINLSAWFDDPPASFLVMWKNVIFGIDSTLGGLFPDRYSSLIAIDLPEGLPAAFTLRQNYPNPFNPTTQVAFDLPRRGFVQLTVYDLLGNQVDQLVNEVMNSGRQTITWHASNLPTGIYFLRLYFEGELRTAKMTLMK